MKPLALVLALVLACPSCSWLFSRPPRAGSECRHDYVSPSLDTSQAVSAGVLALWALSKDGTDDDLGLSLFLAAAAAGQAVLYGMSARYGFDNVRQCRKRDEQQRVTPRLARSSR